MRVKQERASLRLTEFERAQLEKLGNGNVSHALRQAIHLLFKQKGIDVN